MTQYQVALGFEDGVTRFITCQDDQTVADASYRARINIPLDCRDGACGTCKAFCESGDFDPGVYIEDALTEDEFARGYVLPCVMKPKSDLVVQIASTSEVAKTQAATYVGEITELTRLSPTTVSFSVKIPNRDELVFLPGQYVNIAVPGTDETRSYSFSSAPDDKELSFLVKLTPNGVMSTYLDQRAKVGDQLTFTGPNGSFFLREGDGPALLLAGGTGLAPILSILRKLRSHSGRRLHLIYGVNTDDDAVELQTLDHLAGELSNFTWDYCVADKNSAATHKGYVTALMTPEHLHEGDASIYLCGPPPMVDAVREHVDAGGVQPVGFYYERFALSGTGAGARTEPPRPEVEVIAEEVSTAPAAEPLPPERPAPPVEVAAVLAGPEGRAVIGQTIWPSRDLAPLGRSGTAASPADEATTARAIIGQPIARAGSDGPVDALDVGGRLIEAGEGRSIMGQQVLTRAEMEPLVKPQYVIGEEHPSVLTSDAIFDAREALELGALELTIGRLTSQQLTGYRLVAEATMPYVQGEHFTDAAAYTETNAVFHDYLFQMTGNEHLLQAYNNLGVKGRMHDVLRHATWCHPLCAQDHLDIVAAFETGDRDAARALIIAHADRSKQTMRRALQESRARVLPAWFSPGRFEGKTVLVTGSAQGIGQTVVRRIAAEGGEVALVDRSDLVYQEAEAIAASGCHAVGITADLERWDGAEAAVEHAIKELGRIDVLINNVGGAINFKPFTEFTDAEIRAEITRSLLTTLYACRAALPAMVAQGHGVIVNVSSAATRGIHRIPYSAAKGGINALTASLAMEYADSGIRVVGTAPGGTEAPPRRISRGTPEQRNATEQGWYQGHIDQTIDSSLLKRYGTLDEQAAAICFLASDEASYVTGTVLPVAGGDQG
ncbi:benzoate 1,2-dioxygenase electron transfer component BenC [Mycolicibacterium holsaticum]|uniref:Oxidoreductase n=1 Tax=Mycolicibacterium holsaticum TaxID=152142 RepID=A0A1E3RSR8_9MYCO|nr:benzoate 1,2-dioxygenase electron transfer component BenC [Mycolicibacterium holsaticum]ODQ92871.1 oxidoreductase [Mycolicibacterium holsaticum]